MNFSRAEARRDLAAAHTIDPTGTGYDSGLLDTTTPEAAGPDAAGADAGAPDAGGADGDGPGDGGTAAGDAGAAAPGTTGGPGVGLGSEQGLPRLGAALAAGLVSRSHVDVAVRCLARVPAHLAERRDEHGVTGRTKIDVFLTARSRQFCPTTTARLATELLAALDPGGQDRFDPLAHKRRTLSLVTDSTGMTSIRGLLDPASGAVLRAALAHYRQQLSNPPAGPPRPREPLP